MNGETDPAVLPTTVAENLVLVQVADADTRQGLVEWLETHFEVVTGAAADPADADVCLLDSDALSSSLDAIEAARAESEPVLLPVLLLTRPDAADLDAADLTPDTSPGTTTEQDPGREPWDLPPDLAPVVDETIATPVRFPELARRLRSLLRIRELSSELCAYDQRYRSLLDFLAEGVCLVEDGDVVHVNDAACRLLDAADPERVVGRPLTSFVADGDTPAVESLLASVADGEEASQECSLVTVAGEQVPVGVDAVVGTPGTPPRLQLILRDQRAVTHRDDRIELFVEALNGARHGISLADVTRADDPLIYVNETFTEITGYEPAAALGRNCRFLQGDETDPEHVARMRAAIDSGEPTTVRVRNYRADGTMFWNQVHLLPVENEDGRVTHYLGFQRDVTERVQREQELERYRALVQAADDPIYTLDAEGRITDVNDAFIAFTGHDRVDLVGEHASMVVDERDVRKMEDRIAALVAGDDADGDDQPEIIVETADGDRRLCSVSIGLLPADDGFRGTIGILRDITEPKGREQRLAVLERLLRHNLRNKTNVILGHAERLQHAEDLPADLADDIQSIATAAMDLINISDQTRQFRDIVALQRQELTSRDVVQLVANVVAAKRDAHPEVTIETTLPDRAVTKTRGRLRIAIDELVENAIIHNDAADPRVEVTVESRADTVAVAIADNGPGLPECERVIATREQEDPLEHGSGLGLWLVRWTVEQSGGRISFEDDDDDGTVVRLQLPRATNSDE